MILKVKRPAITRAFLEVAGWLKAPKPMQQSRYSSTALREITDSGGHLILVRRGQKYPVWSKWENRKPSLDVALAHDGRLGLIPASIGATALDVDYGDPSELPHTLGQLPDSKAGRGASVLRRR